MSCTNLQTQVNTGIGQPAYNEDLAGTSGSFTTILTAGTIVNAVGGGTVVTKMIIKAYQSSVDQGMIRLFMGNADVGKFLFKEIVIPAYPPVPATTANLQKTFSMELNGGFTLPSGYILYATCGIDTQDYNVMAIGYDYGYCPCV